MQTRSLSIYFPVTDPPFFVPRVENTWTSGTRGVSILRTGPDQPDRKPEVPGVFYELDQKLPTAGLKV